MVCMKYVVGMGSAVTGPGEVALLRFKLEREMEVDHLSFDESSSYLFSGLRIRAGGEDLPLVDGIPLTLETPLGRVLRLRPGHVVEVLAINTSASTAVLSGGLVGSTESVSQESSRSRS